MYLAYKLNKQGDNINKLLHADDTTLMAENEEELKILDEIEKGEWKPIKYCKVISLQLK